LHVTPPPKTPQGVHFFRWVYIREKSWYIILIGFIFLYINIPLPLSI
jgi:hypothetical protein